MENNSFNNNNLSIIYLNQCEDILKQEYNIDDIGLLLIFKQENKTDKSSEKNVKFKLYESCNGPELNLSICGENKINIYTKIKLSENSKYLYEQLKDLGYNMFDINDRFYQDICSKYTTKDNTDIILSDRINYIYNNDDIKCQSNCEYYKYYVVEEYIYCTCDVNSIKTNNNDVVKLDKNKVFIDVLKYSNYKILKCYNLVFTKYAFTKNIGSIILLILLLIHLVCFLNYIMKGLNPLKIKFLRSFKNNNKPNNIQDMKPNSIIENKVLFNIQILKTIKKDIKESNIKSDENISYPPRKSSLSVNSEFHLKDFTGEKIKITKNKKLRKKRRNKNNNKINQNNDLKDKESAVKMNSNENEFEKEKEELDAFELNDLEYKEAIIYDKRTFFQMYLDTLKREHIIIFTFIIYNDFNLFSVKLIKFIFLTASDMAMNVFFFSDESMHKLYLSYGKFDFIQQLSQIIYSTLISQFMEVILCFLGLTDKYILFN